MEWLRRDATSQRQSATILNNNGGRKGRDRRPLEMTTKEYILWITIALVVTGAVVILICGCAGNPPYYSGGSVSTSDMPAPFYEPFPVWTPPQSAFTTRTGNSEYTTFSNGGSAFTTYNGGSSYTTFTP